MLTLLKLFQIIEKRKHSQTHFEASITLIPKPDSSVHFNHSVMSDSLRPHGLQHARLPVHHQLQEFTQTHVY